MLGLAGLFNFIAGIAAVANSRVYVDDAAFIFSDLNTWGWIVLVLAVVQILAAMALLSGSEFARWFGIAAAGVNAIGQLLFVQAYPFWSLALFAMDPDHLRARHVRGVTDAQGRSVNIRHSRGVHVVAVAGGPP